MAARSDEAPPPIGFVRENLYGVLKDIIEWHINGTRYRIRLRAIVEDVEQPQRNVATAV